MATMTVLIIVLAPGSAAWLPEIYGAIGGLVFLIVYGPKRSGP